MSSASFGTVNATTVQTSQVYVSGNLSVPDFIISGESLSSTLAAITNNIQATQAQSSRVQEQISKRLFGKIDRDIDVDPTVLSDDATVAQFSNLFTFISQTKYILEGLQAGIEFPENVSIFDGTFTFLDADNGLEPTTGEMWRGDFNPNSPNLGPAGSNTYASADITGDLLGQSICSLALMATYYTASYTQTRIGPKYSKTSERFQNHAKYTRFFAGALTSVSQLARFLINNYEAFLFTLSPRFSYGLNYIISCLDTNVKMVTTPSGMLDLSATGTPSAEYFTFRGPSITPFSILNSVYFGSVDLFALPFPQGTYDVEANPSTKSFLTDGVSLEAAFNGLTAFYKNLTREFNETDFVFHCYPNGTDKSTHLGVQAPYKYFNPISEQIQDLTTYSYTAGNTYPSDFTFFTTSTDDAPYVGKFTDQTGIFSLPPNFQDFNHDDYISYTDTSKFALVYQWLTTGSDGGDMSMINTNLANTCQQIWFSNVVPASLEAYAAYKNRKMSTFVNDDYPGMWRQRIPDAVSNVNVVSAPYTLNLKNGTSVPLNDDRILELVNFTNNVLDRTLGRVPGEVFPKYTKQNPSMNAHTYITFSNIFANYLNEDIPTVENVTGDMLAGYDTVSNSPCRAMFKSGKELSTLFTDIQDLSIVNGINAGSIVIDTGAGNLTAAQLNTVVNGVLWDAARVYDVLSADIGNRSDFDVLGYYYGRTPDDPMSNVFDSNKFVNLAAMQAQRTTDLNGQLSYVTETLDSNAFGRVTYGPGADGPFTLGFTSRRADKLVYRANYDPSNIAVCMNFDYCHLEVYAANTVTGLPLKNSDGKNVTLQSNYRFNGTRGLLNRLNPEYFPEMTHDTYKCRSYLCQVYNRVFDCLYKYLIIDGYAASGNCLYDVETSNAMRYNMTFVQIDGTLAQSSGSYGFDVYNPWYSDTYGGVTNTNRLGQASTSWNTVDPQNGFQPVYNMMTMAHENFGHGVQLGAFPPSASNLVSSPWVSRAPIFPEAPTMIRDNETSALYQANTDIYPPSSGVSGEGYATLMEIIFIKNNLIPLPDYANVSYFAGTTNYIAAITGCKNVSRLSGRFMMCGGMHDPTSGADLGDVSSLAWSAQTMYNQTGSTNTQFISRGVIIQHQQAPYAVGLITNLALMQMLTEKVEAEGGVFNQSKYNVWRILVSSGYFGQGLVNLGLSYDWTYWV
jgi:hypothetical protein